MLSGQPVVRLERVRDGPWPRTRPPPRQPPPDRSRTSTSGRRRLPFGSPTSCRATGSWRRTSCRGVRARGRALPSPAQAGRVRGVPPSHDREPVQVAPAPTAGGANPSRGAARGPATRRRHRGRRRARPDVDRARDAPAAAARRRGAPVLRRRLSRPLAAQVRPGQSPPGGSPAHAVPARQTLVAHTLRWGFAWKTAATRRGSDGPVQAGACAEESGSAVQPHDRRASPSARGLQSLGGPVRQESVLP